MFGKRWNDDIKDFFVIIFDYGGFVLVKIVLERLNGLSVMIFFRRVRLIWIILIILKDVFIERVVMFYESIGYKRFFGLVVDVIVVIFILRIKGNIVYGFVINIEVIVILV